MRSLKALLVLLALATIGARGCPPPPRSGPAKPPPAQTQKPTPVRTHSAGEGATLGAGADSVMEIDAGRKVRDVPPGVVGWANQWPQRDLWPDAPKDFSDASHAAYVDKYASANAPLVKQAGVRNMSWPWGVTFTSFGVNWENTVGPWSQRKQDCTPRSGWCEKAIIGLDDFLTLAQRWNLEAVTVGAPVMVFDGDKRRWGPTPVTNAFSDGEIDKLSDHAARMVEHMKRHPGWRGFDRVFLSVGCEWRFYSLFPPSQDVLTYVKLVKAVRAKVKDPKIIVVASASDHADSDAGKAASWNRHLYEGLHGTPGVALDLHRYRGQVGVRGTDMSPENIDALMRVGPSQDGFLAVGPEQWGGRGEPMPSVLLENDIIPQGYDLKTKSRQDRPWPAAVAFADLARQAFESPALTFLGWVWAPIDNPAPWPHGAHSGGKLRRNAVALAFISEFHRGDLLQSSMSGSPNIRGNATTNRGLSAYGGNFSRTATTLGFFLRGRQAGGARVEFLDDRGERAVNWDGRTPLQVPPLTLWRVSFD